MRVRPSPAGNADFCRSSEGARNSAEEIGSAVCGPRREARPRSTHIGCDRFVPGLRSSGTWVEATRRVSMCVGHDVIVTPSRHPAPITQRGRCLAAAALGWASRDTGFRSLEWLRNWFDLESARARHADTLVPRESEAHRRISSGPDGQGPPTLSANRACIDSRHSASTVPDRRTGPGLLATT